METLIRYRGDWRVDIRKEFILDPSLSIGAKMVYIALKSHCSPGGDTAFPSSVYLAKCLAVSRDTVFKYVLELKSAGLVETEQRGEHGKFTHTVYTVLDRSGKNPPREKPATENLGTKIPQYKEDLSVRRKEVAALPTPASDALKETKRFKAPSLEEVQLQCSKIGLAESEAERFLNYHASRGWVVGKSPMKNWHFALNTWKMNAAKFKAESSLMPSRFAAKPTRADGEFCANWRNKDTSEMTPKELTAYSIQ